jgi:arabinofuranan 3-O-arabinosyltransferase
MLARQSLVKNLPGIMHGSAPLRSSSSHPCLALLLYSVAYFGWVVASIVPYVVVMRAIVGHNFGVPLALAVPMVCLNALVGQTGFLTAALIGGTLYLIPIRPVLAGICLGLLAHKPQFGLLFPIALIAAGHWRVFVSASVTAIAMFVVSWLAFGTESWLATGCRDARKRTSPRAARRGGTCRVLSMVRYFGGTEQLAWAFPFVLTSSVALVLALMWRSRVCYTLKAAALAAGRCWLHLIFTSTTWWCSPFLQPSWSASD